jgi:hypothetical protein
MENKETIEEAAEKLARAFDNDNYKALMDLVIDGAKWQAERMYSEEEVLGVFEQFQLNLPLHYEFLVKEHLKQFKKK